MSILFGRLCPVNRKLRQNRQNDAKIILSEENKNMIFIPPMYANGYYVLSDRTIFTYKQSTFYGEAKQFAYRWNDGLFNIWWPCKSPLLSERDEAVK